MMRKLIIGSVFTLFLLSLGIASLFGTNKHSSVEKNFNLLMDDFQVPEGYIKGYTAVQVGAYGGGYRYCCEESNPFTACNYAALNCLVVK